MPRNVEVRDPAALVLDDEETVPHSKSRTRYGKEIEGDNGLAVVVKKREPFLGWITPAMEAPQIARHGPLGEHPAELLQLAVDLGRAPVGVLLRPAPNQHANFWSDRRPPRGRDFQRQYKRKPARCQPTTVSGLTITSASFQRDQVARKTVQNRRSRGHNGGLGRFRFKTATCWRRARTSTAMSMRFLEEDAGSGNQGEDEWKHGLLVLT